MTLSTFSQSGEPTSLCAACPSLPHTQAPWQLPHHHAAAARCSPQPKHCDAAAAQHSHTALPHRHHSQSPPAGTQPGRAHHSVPQARCQRPCTAPAACPHPFCNATRHTTLDLHPLACTMYYSTHACHAPRHQQCMAMPSKPIRQSQARGGLLSCATSPGPPQAQPRATKACYRSNQDASDHDETDSSRLYCLLATVQGMRYDTRCLFTYTKTCTHTARHGYCCSACLSITSKHIWPATSKPSCRCCRLVLLIGPAQQYSPGKYIT